MLILYISQYGYPSNVFNISNGVSLQSYAQKTHWYPIDKPITLQSSGLLMFQWIGLRENLQQSPIFNGKIYGIL